MSVQVQVRSGPGLVVWFSLELKFNSLELDSVLDNLFKYIHISITALARHLNQDSPLRVKLKRIKFELLTEPDLTWTECHPECHLEY